MPLWSKTFSNDGLSEKIICVATINGNLRRIEVTFKYHNIVHYLSSQMVQRLKLGEYWGPIIDDSLRKRKAIIEE